MPQQIGNERKQRTKRMKRGIHLWLLCMLILAANLCCCAQQPPADTAAQDSQPEVHRLRLLFAGDLMQHMPQITAARRPDGTYSYEECFSRVRPEIEWADVAIANLEVTLAGPPYSGYPRFSAPDDYLRDIQRAGFDVLLTANNHCVDTRRQGLERTIQMMDSLRIPHLGTYRDSIERRQNYPFLLERNGLRVVLLNFTYDTNGIPVQKPNMVNMMDTTEIARDLEAARQMRPDAIIALPHWGVEYQTLPSEEQRQMAQWLTEHGVDHIIGGHPHVAQPLELSDDSCHLVAWSLGNVISNQSNPNTYGGYMVRMELSKRDSLTTLSDCNYMLYWVSRPHDNGHRHQYRILPIDEPDSLLTDVERQRRDAIRSSMRQLLQQRNRGRISEHIFGTAATDCLPDSLGRDAATLRANP